MPLTDITDLMERMNNLFASAPLDETPIERGPEAQSLFGVPMQEHSAPLRSLAQVYGADGRSMLEQLARDAESGGEAAMAGLLRTLDADLRSGALDLPSTSAPAPRFGRFVYPVV